ncbi:ribosomal L7Ae/L30e/S12e/Gadd45 family protein [Candidatus Micrarchaeota archaeon]|nr:ribosomal L7Ae/L30e/S12e/Gadd45 family protein [Candidatus Micrarchaeota archaeon]
MTEEEKTANEEETTEDTPEEDTEATGSDEETDSGEETGSVAGSEVKGASKKKKIVKEKKVVRRRKSKKEKERPLAAAIRLAVESGKVEFGSRSALSSDKKVKAFVVSGNTPEIKSQLMEKSLPVIEFDGTSIELGSICGKPFSVSVLSIYEEGSSNILSLLKKK